MGHAPSLSYSKLQEAAFIPVKTEKGVQLFSPSSVYFQKTDNPYDMYGTAFTFVDFGEQANTFLRSCGVRSEPSPKGEPGIRQVIADDRYRKAIHARARQGVETGWIEREVCTEC